jgi:penicillin-binding protein 1C
LDKLVRAGPAPDPADPRLRSTLDLRVQAEVRTLLRAHLAQWRGAGAQQAAAMVVRREGREVLASVGSAGDGGPGDGIDFTRAPRSPGSTLKPFLYARALDRGVLRPDEVMQDRPDGAAGIGNADGLFLGPLLPRQALANSRNVPAATLLRRIGLQTAFDALRDFGLHDSNGPAERFGLSMAIGALPSSLARLVRGYATLADGGRAGDLIWLRDAPVGERPRVIGEDAARLVGLFLADPMARLPSFPRYGDSEYPFAVALKTGTSQGFRDAWTLAWSRDFVVGVWVGRADDGPMHGLSGARTAGSLANAILLALHGAGRCDLTAGDFAPPAGRVAREICTDTAARGAACASRLTEFVAPQPPDAAPAETVRLSIVAPEPNSRIWRNPEVPAAVNRLALKAASEPRVPQVVWLVDGAPVGTADPAKPFFWPMTPGPHRLQVRLPFAATASASVRVVVE